MVLFYYNLLRISLSVNDQFIIRSIIMVVVVVTVFIFDIIIDLSRFGPSFASSLTTWQQ